jgi:hypothetical protein
LWVIKCGYAYKVLAFRALFAALSPVGLSRGPLEPAVS